MGSNTGSEWLEICVPNKPVESPFQITKCVFKSFGPILLFIEALCNGVIFHFVILDSAKIQKTLIVWHIFWQNI